MTSFKGFANVFENEESFLSRWEWRDAFIIVPGELGAVTPSNSRVIYARPLIVLQEVFVCILYDSR